MQTMRQWYEECTLGRLKEGHRVAIYNPDNNVCMVGLDNEGAKAEFEWGKFNWFFASKPNVKPVTMEFVKQILEDEVEFRLKLYNDKMGIREEFKAL